MQVNVPEAARLLRVSEQTVRRRLRSGELHGRQVTSPGGFLWMVEIPDELPVEDTESGEIVAMKALVVHLEAQVAAQQEQLTVKDKQMDAQVSAHQEQITAKDRQIEQLHVLLQQAQASLPAPRGRRPWWKWWISR
jgi:hypothetical protein